MLNTLKHPLFKRELDQIKWPTLLLTIAILLPVLIAINSIDPTPSQYSWTMDSIDFIRAPYDLGGWLVSPILIISQFFYTRKESVIGLLASLPYDRNTHITYKYFAGVIGIIFAYFVGFLVIASTYFSAGHPITGSFSPIIIWLLVVTASSLFQYSVLFLTATLMGNSVFAGFGGFFIFYAPIFIVGSVLMNLDTFFDFYVDFEPILKIFMPHYIVYTGSWYNKTSIMLMDFVPMLFLYFTGSMVTFKLAQKAFNQNDFEYNGNMCMFVWAEKVFLVGFTLCFGFLGLDFAQTFQSGWLYPLAVVIGLACFPLGFILGTKLLQVTGHQVQFKRS